MAACTAAGRPSGGEASKHQGMPVGDRSSGKMRWVVKEGGGGRESCLMGMVFSMRWPTS